MPIFLRHTQRSRIQFNIKFLRVSEKLNFSKLEIVQQSTGNAKKNKINKLKKKIKSNLSLKNNHKLVLRIINFLHISMVEPTLLN